MSFRSSRHRHTRLLICCAMTVCGLLFSVSLFGQSVSEIIIQRERAKLQAEHPGKGFEALSLRTYEGVNHAGQPRTLGREYISDRRRAEVVLEDPLTVRVYQSAAVVTTTVLWIVGRLIVLGTRVWAHSWAQSASFSLMGKRDL